MVCVHGNPTWSFLWRDVIQELSPELQVLAPDHLGCGLSDMPDPLIYRYTLEERVEDLRSLVESVAPVGPIHLVVHDWGGMIGMSWALNPQVQRRIASITAMNTACFLLPQGKAFPWMLRVLKSVPRMAEALTLYCNLFAATAATTCTVDPLPSPVKAGFLYPYRNPARRVATHRFVQDIPENSTDSAYERAFATDRDCSQAFAEVPMFLPWGLRDYVFDGDFLAEWQRRFPQARALPLAQAGHYVLEDGGRWLIREVGRHIRHAAGPALKERNSKTQAGGASWLDGRDREPGKAVLSPNQKSAPISDETGLQS